MAASVHAVAAGLSLSRAAPANQASGSSSASRQSVAGPVRKSPFFGVAKVFDPLGSSKPVSKLRAGSSAIVSASFFEKLAKLFTDSEEDKEQVFGVFEFNEGDRGSPFVVKNNSAIKVLAVGDFVPYNNKVYDCTAKKFLGLSAGLCSVVETNLATGGCHYEVTMSHYMGDYGHISCQGPYFTYQDSNMAVTGGTGIFKGARGWVKCHNINGPLKLLYTYHIKGISKLPAELTQTPAVLEEEKQASNTTVVAEKVKV